MLVLITYDVNTTTPAGRKRLSKIAKECTNYGQRVQCSVFECDVDSAQFVKMRNELIAILDDTQDSLRIYHLGKRNSKVIERYGIKEAYDPEGELIF